MALLTSLAGRFTQVALIGPAMARAKRRAVRIAIGGALVAVFGITGFAYLLIALRYELERYIGPIWTPLAIGGVLILAAAIAYFAFIRPRPSEAERVEAKAAAVRDKIVAPARRLESQVADRPLQSLAIAMAVGFAAASLLRLLRGREQPIMPRTVDGTGAAPERAAPAERPAWMREVVLRETDRRRGNGQAR